MVDSFHLDNEKKAWYVTVFHTVHELPDVLHSPLGGSIGESHHAVILKRYTLHFNEVSIPLTFSKYIYPGVAVGELPFDCLQIGE